MKNCNTEVWKNVMNYEGLYQISNFGNVRSLDRKVKRSDDVVRSFKGKVLALNNSKLGYYQVQLCKEGICKRYYVHRLVAQNFIDNPENVNYVNHIDGNRLNNVVVNLEWCTHRENIIHAINTGLFTREQRLNHKGSIKVEQLSLDGELIKIHVSYSQAERDVGIRSSNISYSVKTGKPRFGYLWRNHITDAK